MEFSARYRAGVHGIEVVEAGSKCRPRWRAVTPGYRVTTTDTLAAPPPFELIELESIEATEKSYIVGEEKTRGC